MELHGVLPWRGPFEGLFATMDNFGRIVVAGYSQSAARNLDMAIW